MPASHLHSLNQLAGKETEPQGLCQAAGEPPTALLVGLKEASCFIFGKPCQRLTACFNCHHLLQSCTVRLFRCKWAPISNPQIAGRRGSCHD